MRAVAREALLKVASRYSLQSVAGRLALLPESVQRDWTRLEKQISNLFVGSDGPAIDSIHHLLAGGGKRVRPLLCLLAGWTSPPARPPSSLVSLAQAAELVHAASLLHDDVIDLGELRRGRPTSRMIYGNAASVLGGDFLLVQSFRLTRAAGIPELLDRLLDVLTRMITAESLQLERRGRTDVIETDYFEIVSGKTAALFEWCMEAGARAVRAPDASRAALRLFAHEIGVAFQLVDDVLDFSLDPSSVGKAVLQDIRGGTMTYPLIKALASRPGIREWLTLPDEGEDETAFGEALIEMVRGTGGVEATQREVQRRTERARETLSVLPESRARDVLAALAEGLAARTS